ncbi:hypothetical protein [Halorientalis salina]|uniref:hypothetical protein n=1 Tax=Halorientalis salina TaxID=2932266 RepID=UPI0010AB6CD1|nr:hypothetical protein [Halorientalis salina]
MSKAKSSTTGRTFTVVDAMDATGRLTVRAAATGETYEVVDFVDELVRERVKTLSPGSTVQLEVTPCASSERGCTVTRVLPATPLGPLGAD